MLRFALPPRRETRLSDDRIHAVLRAAEDAQVPAAELCEQHGVTIPEYCVLKKKYGGLSLDELRARRRREASRRTRLLTVAGAALALVVIVGVGLFVSASAAVRRGGTSADTTAVAPDSAPPLTPPTAQAASPDAGAVSPATTPSSPSGRPSIARETRPGAERIDRTPRASAEAEGYAVQVAAMPEADGARRAAERLTAAGFPAYVRPTAVGTTTVYRVRVGPFPTRGQAGHTLADLVRAGHPGAWITK